MDLDATVANGAAGIAGVHLGDETEVAASGEFSSSRPSG